MDLRALLVVPLVLAFACAPLPSSLDAGLEDGGVIADAGAVLDSGVVAGDGGFVATAAVVGARCALHERIGLVELQTSGDLVFAYASLFDRPAPWFAAPKLSDETCAFYVGPDGSACACDLDEVCAFDGSCVARPQPADSVRLVVRAGGADQTLSEQQGFGTIGGEVTLGGTTFAVELRGLSQVITLGDTAVPGALVGLSGALTGTSEAPEAIDIQWDAPAAGTFVFTHIPINHHVAAETFTECVVDATTGALHVDEAMLTPLAVSTGLEFQGISHVRFAAAETPIGCVELRFFTSSYVELGF